MQANDFLSEADATMYGGVTASTLARFAEAGYLHIKSDSTGKPLYSKQELFDVFGISELRSGIVVSKESVAEATANTSLAEEDEEEVKEATTIHEEPETDFITAPSHEKAQTKNPHTETDHAHEIRRLKLENVIAIQERMLDAREAELKELKEERDWLRTRLERLEEKSERDQMLLLSEGQTIRRLLSMQENKKSPIRLALEWLGISEPSSSISHQTSTDQKLNGKTIEI